MPARYLLRNWLAKYILFLMLEPWAEHFQSLFLEVSLISNLLLLSTIECQLFREGGPLCSPDKTTLEVSTIIQHLSRTPAFLPLFLVGYMP